VPHLIDGKRIHIWIEAEDHEWYKARFGHTIGLSRAFQIVLRAWRKNMESKAEARANGLPFEALPEELEL
jgi:hypothetical protein